MTKDNWIKAFDELCNFSDLCCACKDDHEVYKSFISQVEKDAIEKTNKRLRNKVKEKIDILTYKQGLLSTLTVKNILSDLLEDKK